MISTNYIIEKDTLLCKISSNNGLRRKLQSITFGVDYINASNNKYINNVLYN